MTKKRHIKLTRCLLTHLLEMDTDGKMNGAHIRKGIQSQQNGGLINGMTRDEWWKSVSQHGMQCFGMEDCKEFRKAV